MVTCCQYLYLNCVMLVNATMRLPCHKHQLVGSHSCTTSTPGPARQCCINLINEFSGLQTCICLGVSFLFPDTFGLESGASGGWSRPPGPCQDATKQKLLRAELARLEGPWRARPQCHRAKAPPVVDLYNSMVPTILPTGLCLHSTTACSMHLRV